MSADNPAWDRISSRQREKLFGRFKPTLNATRYRRMAHDGSLWSDFPLSFITLTCPVQSGFLRSHTRAGNLVIGGDDSEPTSRTPKLPLSHSGVYLLSGKTFPALTSKLALAEQSLGGALSTLRRSGTPLAIVFSGRLSPPLHPDQLAGFSSDFLR